MRRFLLSIVAVALLHGCSKSTAGDVEPYSSGARSYVEVTNNFALPVEIFATGSGTTLRLGTVHPGMSAHFVLPSTMGQGRSVEFRASPGTGFNAYRSAELLVQPGTIIDLQVASVLFNSSAVIRPRS